MKPCSHATERAAVGGVLVQCGITLTVHGVPACETCQRRWPGGTEPPVETLRTILPRPDENRVIMPDAAPEPEARPRCGHLGKVVKREACNCWQKSRYECLAGHGVIVPEDTCVRCGDWVADEDGDL